MDISGKRNKAILFVIVVSTLAVGAIVYLLASSLFLPRDQGDFQNSNQLKIPPLLEDRNPDPNTADFVLNAQPGKTDFIESGSTNTFGYNGTYLGPVMRIHQGELVNVQVNNLLSFPTTIHWHGLVVDGEQDGGQSFFIHLGVLKVWETILVEFRS